MAAMTRHKEKGAAERAGGAMRGRRARAGARPIPACLIPGFVFGGQAERAAIAGASTVSSEPHALQKAYFW